MGSGGSSSGGGLRRATTAQKRKIENIKRSLAKNNEISGLRFTMRQDGNVAFSYTETKVRAYVHGGKMQSESKNDTVETVNTYTGTIGKDGLIKRKKAGKTSRVLKRGKR